MKHLDKGDEGSDVAIHDGKTWEGIKPVAVTVDPRDGRDVYVFADGCELRFASVWEK